jgi:anti-sigma factor RsiW
MRWRLEKRLERYRDGRASKRERARLEKLLASDPDAAAHLHATEWLGRSVREAWLDGPPAPSADRILTAIRPALRQIDAERAATREASWSWRRVLGPVPLTAFAAATAALALFLAPADINTPLVRYANVMAPQYATVPVANESLGSPTGIYDLAQEGDKPVMVFEATDGSTVIWVLEEDDGISSSASKRGLV